jgi:hypothetical protein
MASARSHEGNGKLHKLVVYTRQVSLASRVAKYTNTMNLTYIRTLLCALFRLIRAWLAQEEQVSKNLGIGQH